MTLIDAIHIRCGATSPDPITQARLDALTAEHDRATGEDHTAGCGVPVLWWDAYRCLDCDKFMHKECLRQHFIRTATSTAPLAADCSVCGDPTRCAGCTTVACQMPPGWACCQCCTEHIFGDCCGAEVRPIARAT